MLFLLFVVIIPIGVFGGAIRRKLFKKKPLDISRLGTWGVVTGATDGIGKAFAEELASSGLNILLISRNIDKLESVAKEIGNKYSVTTKAIQAEFTLFNEEMYAHIEKEVSKLDVGVLVNNVGMFSIHPEYFHDINNHENGFYQDIINCNLISAVQMCRFTLPGMVSRKKGLIINVSSLLSELPSPLITMYSATKAFLAKFSTDLGIEYKKDGVKVHLLKTGPVATKLLRVRKTSWMVPSAKTYVQSALKEAASQESLVSTGYSAHTVLGKLASFVLIFSGLLENKFCEIALERREAMKNKCSYCNPSLNDQQSALTNS